MSKKLNIGVLSKLTKIPTETLRTWERRYGFPIPERTESGHRRYSDDAVQRLVHVRKLLDHGYKPSEILGMDVGQLQALASRRNELAAEIFPPPTSVFPVASVQNGEDASTVEELVKFAREMRSGALQRSFELMWHHQGANVFLESTAPQFLKSIGDAWSTKTICVEHEHMASECLQEFLSAKWRPLSESAGGPVVVCATPSGEQHSLGLHLVALALALVNVKVTFLGANTPTESISAAALQQKASGIALSASPSIGEFVLQRCIHDLHAQAPHVSIIVGGDGAPKSIDHALVAHNVVESQAWARHLNRRYKDTVK